MQRLRSGLLAAIVLALAIASPAAAHTSSITTVAGTGLAAFGGDGGLATDAQINLPRAVSTTADGGFLITDRGNDRVRRVWPDGTMTTVAGTGVAGFAGDGGPATAADLDFIHAAVQTSDGGLLISDTRNQRIRQVTPAGTISTIAGSGAFGCFCSGSFAGDGGPATSARLNNPHGIAIAADGSILIADTDNNRIRRVDPSGTITTVAGSGPWGSSAGGFSGDGGMATAARLNRPFDVAPMPHGGFVISDQGNDRVRRVWPDGTITTVAGTGIAGFSGDGGPATSAQVSSLHDLAATPAGGFVIADEGNNRVRRVSAGGTITTVAGTGVSGFSGDGGPPKHAQLDAPKGVAVYPNGRILIADEANQRIRLVVLP